jgi:hypothetical protein
MPQEGAPPPGVRQPRFAEAAVDVERLAGGGMILRSPHRLGPVSRAVGVWLEHWT